MIPLPDAICLLHQDRKGVVELGHIRYPKLMDVEALRVRRHTQEPTVAHVALQIEEPVQRRLAGLCASETPTNPFEGDRRFRDTHGVRSAGIQQLHETLIEVDNACGFVSQMPLDAPLLGRIHCVTVCQGSDKTSSDTEPPEAAGPGQSTDLLVQ